QPPTIVERVGNPAAALGHFLGEHVQNLRRRQAGTERHGMSPLLTTGSHCDKGESGLFSRAVCWWTWLCGAVDLRYRPLSIQSPAGVGDEDERGEGRPTAYNRRQNW